MKKLKLFSLICILLSIAISPLSEVMTLDNTATVQAATINQKTKNLLKSEKYTLKITGSSSAVSWSTSDSQIATVTSAGKVTAKNAGTATITAKVGNKKYTCNVTVRDSVDLIIFMGQSNMTGRGDSTQAPALSDGAGYEYKAVTNPSALSVIKEPFGKSQDSGYLQNYGLETGSLVTSFVNQYFGKTGTPVVAIAATRAGSGSGSWSGENEYGINLAQEAAQRYSLAVSYLQGKGIKINKKYMVWYQGENDVYAYKDKTTYQRQIKTVFNTMKTSGVNRCLLIRIGLHSYPSKDSYDTILKAQTDLCKKYVGFVLISAAASSYASKYFQADGMHLTQAGLNALGKNAGFYAAQYTLTNKESSMTDKYFGGTYTATK